VLQATGALMLFREELVGSICDEPGIEGQLRF